MPKIAFFSSSTEDYLADSVFHGLRSLLGADVVDFPKAERMYTNCPPLVRQHIRGGGFTLYGLLPDIDVERQYMRTRILAGEFDLVVFGNIYVDFGAFVELAPSLDPRKVVVLDGADWEAMYPYAGNWWRHLAHWLLPRANRTHYFKRELTPRTLHYRSYRLFPEALCRRLGPPGHVQPIAFSIPEEKVLAEPPAKSKLLATHVVDEEIAARLGGASVQKPFLSEADYARDLQASRFAITTKRAGWDCLRHYEIAANGTVPCFRDLGAKPATCAPHGLDASNCVIYRSFDDLMAQILAMPEDRYRELQQGAMLWARENTTKERARQLLRQVGLS